MKYPKISALFGAAMSWFQGGADGKQGSLTAEQQASLDASEKKLGEMEDELAQAKAANEAHTKTIGERDAKITELNTQVTSLTEANTKLTAELAAKPTGHPTTVISKESKEAEQAADTTGGGKKGNYATSVDAELAELKKQKEALTIKQ